MFAVMYTRRSRALFNWNENSRADTQHIKRRRHSEQTSTLASLRLCNVYMLESLLLRFANGSHLFGVYIVKSVRSISPVVLPWYAAFSLSTNLHRQTHYSLHLDPMQLILFLFAEGKRNVCFVKVGIVHKTHTNTHTHLSLEPYSRWGSSSTCRIFVIKRIMRQKPQTTLTTCLNMQFNFKTGADKKKRRKERRRCEVRV